MLRDVGPLTNNQDRRQLAERVVLTIVLPAVAGAVNASGFLEVGSYTSHMTGHVARMGDELAQGHAHLAWGELGLLLLFLAGAITATVLVERAKRLARARYVAPLLVQCAVLSVFAGMAGQHAMDPDLFALAGLLCFAMGLQNALVTKISGARVRTTHVTGIVTDIGIESVRLALWLRAEWRRCDLRQAWGIWRRFLFAQEVRRLRLHVLILTSFFLGAIVGPALFLRYGQVAMMGPCAVLLVLAGFDFALGIQDASS